MSLHSKLFRGDPKLQACLLKDVAHVTPGTAGNHVSKIQTALALLNNADIDDAEISGMRYGTATANAVLAYKKKRKIINYSYQTAADNIVGRMTIAALDREMLMREALTYPSCNYGSNMPHPILAFAIPADFTPAPAPGLPLPPPPPPPAQLFVVMKSLPGTKGLVEETLKVLEAVADGSMQPADNAALASQALKTHYLSTDAELVATARQVRVNLEVIIKVLKGGGAVFVPGVPGDPDGGGAYAYSRAVRDGKIYVNPEFLRLAEFGRKLVLVHEAFHSLSANIVDHCRNPDNDAGKTYRIVPKNLRPTNAYSLSQFVLHIRLKAEKTIDVEEDKVADLAP